MDNSSNTPDYSASIEDRAYRYALHTNVSNFVSVKLSGHHNYHLWKKQMLCLMNTHDMCRPVDDDPTSIKIMDKYDRLLQGWIFGSLSEDALRLVLNLHSAQSVWEKLKSCFDTTIISKQDSTLAITHTKSITQDKNASLRETATNDNDMGSIEPEAKAEGTTHIKIKDSTPTIAHTRTKTENKNITFEEIANNDKSVDSIKPEAKGKEITQSKLKDLTQTKAHPKTKKDAKDAALGESDANDKAPRKMLKKIETINLRQRLKDWNWFDLYVNLKERTGFEESIKTEGNSSLHIAVVTGQNHMFRSILQRIEDDELTKLKNSEGSTALHIAAIVGNTYAAKLLVEKNKILLLIKDNKDQTPLDNACRYMHLDTIESLLDAHNKSANDDETSSTFLTSVETGVQIVVTAFSTKQYNLALKLIRRNPKYVVSNDHILRAMATTFPRGLKGGERFIYPSLDVPSISKMILKRGQRLFEILVVISTNTIACGDTEFPEVVLFVVLMIFLLAPLGIFVWMYHLICLLLLMVYFTFYMFYFLLWKAAAIVVPLIKNIEQKKKEFDLAKKILGLVCDQIPYSSPELYTRPILEAVSQDAYEVVDEILGRWPEAFMCKDNNGYNIIQLATLHRSERIYNLVYIIGELRSIYREVKDSFDNNMLHLVGKLAPANKLTRRTGAALQLQRELQWRQEVEKLVFPACVNKKNMTDDTPEMLFTKEHKDLLKEGEQWMKTVAESCSITAALITTIVFAAAITVPGGSNQETGIPIFKKKNAFTIFAIADAISLFSSTTALLVFLSILTARFAEQDFLVSLPRRLIIGLCTLFISTTAMMVAFSATLFLVSSPHKVWVLAPICGFAFLPIAVFFVLQFPLILDLCWSTYIFKFGNSETKKSKFRPKLLLQGK